jgi:hypothetical protein
MAFLNEISDKLGQRTDRGRRFEKALVELHTRLAAEPDLARKANEQLRRLNLTPGAVSSTPVLQELSIAYANDDYIGTRLMPVVPSSKLTAEIWKRDKATGFSYPDSEIGTEGSVNEVSEKVTNEDVALKRHALKEHIDAWTLDEADSLVAELIDPMLNVMDGLEFNREVALAAVLGTSTAFGSNTTAIAAANRWDTANGGNPGKVVATAKESLWSGTGPGRWVAYCSLSVYNALKANPVILDRVKYTGTTSPAMVTREVLAAYFEVDELIVGMGRKNTANENQTASYSRIWPNIFGIVRVAQRPARRSASFGITLEQAVRTEQWYRQGDGGRGAYYTQASRAEKPVVLCADCGYLITTPIG